MMQFGDILSNLLEDRDLSQKQFAHALNLAPSTVSNYVQNTRQPDFEILCRIAKYFNVSTDYLLDHRSGNEHSPLESELICIFRTLTPEQQRIYIEQGKVFSKLNQKEKESSSKQIS